MQRLFAGIVASAAIAASATFCGAGTASAQVAGARIATHANNPGTLATPVQWRGRRVYVGPRWRGVYRPGWRRWGYYGPRYRRWGYYGPGWGWWGPGAFASGVIIGGALAAPRYYYGYPARAYRYDPAIEYCIRRFKSYDLRTMTYLGYDGRRHPCP
jgi:hypothetical protein